MPDTPFFFLLEIALLAMGVMALESRIPRAFSYLPGIVVVYALSMLFAQVGWIPQSDAVSASYATLKSNLLPAMLFLLLLQIELRAFSAMGRSVLVAYIAALLSLFVAFVSVFAAGGFSLDESGIFAALGGSWMGGTANMIAVAAAFDVSESALGYALIVDSFNYTLWVTFLLLLVPFAERFNRWSGAAALHERLEGIGCSCTIGPKRYWSLLLLSLSVALLCQIAAPLLGLLGTTTWVVLLATLLGVGASFTPLKTVAGSSELGRTMLYLLVALIGSQAHFESAQEVLRYMMAGSAILLMHAMLMVLAARWFRLDLFSIAVASLANIGGVASAPLLAAAYDRALIGVAVLMAITGYLIGTFGGLLLGTLLQYLAS